MACGIYVIENIINRKCYVGQTVDHGERFRRHKTLLRNNKHYNKHLQRSVNKHGLNNFLFKLIENCSVNCLTEREQYWINYYKKINILYNNIIEVEDFRGKNNPFFGKHHTESTKIKMSLSKKGKYTGTLNPNFGGIFHGTRHSKLQTDDIVKIKSMLFNRIAHAEIASMFKVSRTVITRISNGTRWGNITGGPIFPVEYKDGKRLLSEDHKRKIGAGRKGKLHSLKSKKKMHEKAIARWRSI